MSSLPRFPIILDRVKSTFPDRAQSSVSLSASQQSGAARGIFSVHISQNPGQKGQSGALTWPEWQNQSGQDGIFRRSSVAGTQIRASRRFYSPAFLPCRGAMWLREGRSWSASSGAGEKDRTVPGVPRSSSNPTVVVESRSSAFLPIESPFASSLSRGDDALPRD